MNLLQVKKRRLWIKPQILTLMTECYELARPNGPRMFFMLKRGLDFIAGRIMPMQNYDEVLEIELDIPGNLTKIRVGYDGNKVIVAVLPEDSMQLPSIIHINPNNTVKE